MATVDQKEAQARQAIQRWQELSATGKSFSDIEIDLGFDRLPLSYSQPEDGFHYRLPNSLYAERQNAARIHTEFVRRFG